MVKIQGSIYYICIFLMSKPFSVYKMKIQGFSTLWIFVEVMLSTLTVIENQRETIEGQK